MPQMDLVMQLKEIMASSQQTQRNSQTSSLLALCQCHLFNLTPLSLNAWPHLVWNSFMPIPTCCYINLSIYPFFLFTNCIITNSLARKLGKEKLRKKKIKEHPDKRRWFQSISKFYFDLLNSLLCFY